VGIIPQLASKFPQIACHTAVVGSELFLSFPREKPSLIRQREREKFDLRVPPQLGHVGVSPGK
jgi:hypothetical protein